MDPDWFASVAAPGWQERWQANFVANMSAGELPDDDLVNDGWTDLAKRIRGRLTAPAPPRRLADLLADFENADHEKMAEIRARVDAVVADPATADRLKAWYRQLCKRPCFHDEYLSAFNRPSVHLVDTDGRGVERITPAGGRRGRGRVPGRLHHLRLRIRGRHRAKRRYGFDLTGRDGIRLSEYWSGGMRSMHGVHVHGFPNAFLVQLGQGGNFVANVPHNLNDAARTVAGVVAHMRAAGLDTVEVSREAEDAWMEQLAPNPVMARSWRRARPATTTTRARALARTRCWPGTRRARPPTSATSGSGATPASSRGWSSAGRA